MAVLSSHWASPGGGEVGFMGPGPYVGVAALDPVAKPWIWVRTATGYLFYVCLASASASLCWTLEGL